MLRPQESDVRDRKALGGVWGFVLDPSGLGRADRWFAGRLPRAREMPVPASYNDVPVDPAVRDHVGEVWYETAVWVPAGWAGRRIALYFESVTHRATVWVDGTEVVTHEGGYTPFEADLTNVVRPGERARITVAVDNRLSYRTIPPGVIVPTPAGPKQRYWHDFFNYAGIHRQVWLYATAPSYVEDLTVHTGLDGSTGSVAYEVGVAGAGRVEVVLRSADEVPVATGSGAAGTLSIPDVHPWQPGEGYLYELEARLLDAAGEIVDRYRLPVGVRTVTVDGPRFLINGKSFYFKGFGKHEDVPVLGKGHSDAFLVHDFALLDWLGANSFRTSHYPYAEGWLDYADRHGIVVIDETPAVGLNIRAGAGDMYGGAGLATFSAETLDERTQAAHARAIRELIARDRNHPSVVLWSIANEPESSTDAARRYFEPLFTLVRELDPTRPVGFVNDAGAPYGECQVSRYSDVLMLNRYYGWYVQTGDLAAAQTALEQELRAWAGEGKPIIVTEYGADTYPGLHATVPTPWTEEFQVAFLDAYHRVFDRIDAVVGEHPWNFADFATTSGVARVGGNRKGVFTRDRQPKAAAYALRRRWRPDA
jgi:beta-glucuronidase